MPSVAPLLNDALRRLLFTVTLLSPPLLGDAAAAFSPRWHRCRLFFKPSSIHELLSAGKNDSNTSFSGVPIIGSGGDWGDDGSDGCVVTSLTTMARGELGESEIEIDGAQ
ncbi:hypothetical protein HN51_047919 [Arachis hypogaea]